MKKLSLFKKIRMWFFSRARMIKEISKIYKILDERMSNWIEKIEELDQSKVYAIIKPGMDKDTAETIQSAIEEITKRMKWTPPRFIMINAELETLDIERSKKLLEKLKKGSVQQ